MRRAVKVVAPVLAIVALLAGPGLVAKGKLSDAPDELSFTTAFRAIAKNFPDLELDAAAAENRAITGAGGLSAPVRCLPNIGGGSGWMCVALSTDGARLAAVWRASDPDAEPGELLFHDNDGATAPNP